jgi:UPF0755 protein
MNKANKSAVIKHFKVPNYSIKQRTKWGIFAFIIIALFGVILVVVFEQKLNTPLTLSKVELITIKNGTSIGKLSTQLVKKNWLDSRFWLRNYPKLHPEFANIKAGTYQIKVGTTVKQLLKQLILGKEYQFEITFVEGTTFKQWLALLQQQPYINHNLNAKSVSEIAHLLGIKHDNPEGLFFPDTYAYTAGENELTILQRAYQKMSQQLTLLWEKRAPELPLKSPYQALIMASIIEKETSKVVEQPLIASVFINRLAKNMRLQTDPTVIYGLGERYHGDITRKHLKEKTAYNTYRIKGLPPTPIAMPGKSALQASMHPAKSNYLYFVSKGNGYHVFSARLKAHNQAVKRFLLAPTQKKK